MEASNNNDRSYTTKEEKNLPFSLSDIILATIYTSNNGVIEGRSTLQRLVYLAYTKVGDDKLINRPKFITHYYYDYYGPYSYEVALTLDQLVSMNLVEEDIIKQRDDNSFDYIYKLSEDGKKIINNNKERYDAIRKYIRDSG